MISRPCGISETRLLRVGSTSVRVRDIWIGRRFHGNLDFLDLRRPSIRGVQEMPIRRFWDCDGVLFAPRVSRIPLESSVFSVFSGLLDCKISPPWARPFFYSVSPRPGCCDWLILGIRGFEVPSFLRRFVFWVADSFVLLRSHCFCPPRRPLGLRVP